MTLFTPWGLRCLLESLGPRLEALFHPMVLFCHPTLDLGLIRAQTNIRVHRSPCFPMHVLSLRDTRGASMRITTEMERLMSETACGLTLVRSSILASKYV